MKICLTCEGVSPDTGAAARCAHCGGPLLDTAVVHFPERRGDDDARSPLVGRVVDGKYRVVGVLGRGGMGTVYRAVHEVSLMPVALKVLHPRFAARRDFRAWFLGEARKAGRVVHENSARVMDVGVARDGMVYIAVEFVDGLTLHEWMADGPIAPARVVSLLEQIARALAAAHAAGVVHRDLSPRNVMVTVRDGRSVAKILDFGIAIGPPPPVEDDPSHEHDGAPSGFANPPYSAPEHLAGEPVDGRADLYSLGVIAYEAITGELPVAGNTGRELARATLHGRVRPMRVRSGVPAVFVRLVNHLLARKPEDRPSTADEVAERLARIRQPGRRALAALSVVALVASTAAFAIAHAPSTAPAAYFGTSSGRLGVRNDRVDEDVQQLRSADVQATAFEFGGFDPEELWIDVTPAHGAAERIEIGQFLRIDGSVLRFGADAAPAVGRLAELSADGPVELRFSAAGGAPLGFARLRIDDQPPRVELRVDRPSEDASPSALRGDDLIVVRIDEDAAAEIVVELARRPDEGQRNVVVGLEGRAVDARAADLLGAWLPGPRSRGAATLRVDATDAAGNAGHSATVELSDVDLAVPQIVEVTSAQGGKIVVLEEAGPRLQVRLDAEELGLVLLASPPGEDRFFEVSDLRAVGDRLLDVRLRPASGSGSEQKGWWTFQVRDRAGNTSAPFVDEIDFRTADPAAELEAEVADPEVEVQTVAWIGDVLVGSGAALRLTLRHNSIYEVDRVSLMALARGASDVVAEVEAAESGRTTLRVPGLPPGTYDLADRLVEPLEERVRELPPWRLWILPPQVVLRVPDVARARHLPELEECSLLRRDAGDRIGQGAGWRLDPADTRLLRGSVWTGVGDRPVPQEPLAAESADAPILAAAPLGRGLHTVAVDLSDVLGRPVTVLRGDAPAPAFPLPGGRQALEIVRFFHHDAPVSPVETLRFVEHGQPVRVELRSALPEEDLDAIRVRVAGADCRRVAIDSAARRVTFEVPFESVALAAELAALPPAEFAEGKDRTLRMTVWTPVGEQDLELSLRTSRSTLRQLVLGDLVERRLPAEIAGIKLVPVPVPGGVWPDPVPAAAQTRRRFRPAPAIAVRNVPDFYLQDRETTRGQYAAIVRAGLSALRARGRAFDARALVHQADPLGVGRLTEEAMVPNAQGDDPQAFVSAVEADPARPVSGVDAFQAHAVVALLGLCVADDPRFFRLPLGSELEVAALAGGEFGVLNGSAARGPGLGGQALSGLARSAGRLVRWPPSAAELDRCGDFVTTELGDRVFGLDTGLREWVLDLPFLPGGSDSRALLEEWLADHSRHVQQAWALATHTGDSAGGRMPTDVRAFAETYGVVRGVAVDRDAAGGLAAVAALPPDWPGVVTTLQIRRDGAGLVPGRGDPRIASCGFRLAGGERFVDEVRARW